MSDAIYLRPCPNQSVQFVRNDEAFTVEINSRLGKLYATVTSDKEGLIVANRVCLNRAPITKNLVFVDLHGNEHPNYEGLGSRFLVCWVNDEAQAN
ncbi:hypothetical protein AAEX37_01949 [Oligella sp. MSHR50489EDL]|uniref:phage baseplate plug family protein n=1 Tax=Oligella sp. MSHR50489EDL TaxID=3139409 RepID=UPI003D81A7A0